MFTVLYTACTKRYAKIAQSFKDLGKTKSKACKYSQEHTLVWWLSLRHFRTRSGRSPFEHEIWNWISRNFQWRMEQQFPEFLEKRTTSRGIPKFSKNFVSEFPFHLISSWNFRLKLRFGNVRILPKTFPGSLYRAICPRLESSGIFGWMKSARCFLKNLSYYVLKNNWQYLTCGYLVNYLPHENPQ